MKKIPSIIGSLAGEVLPVALPSLLLPGAAWGMFVGPRWLGIACLATLGALFVAVLAYAIYGGVTIPTKIARSWSTYGRGEKAVLGCAGVVLTFFMVVLALTVIQLLLV